MKAIIAALLVCNLFDVCAQNPTVPVTPAPSQAIYGAVPIPWTGIWEVKHPVLTPGLDYHINRYSEWKADVLRAFDQATTATTEAAKKLPPESLWAVVMDIDDTILDHSMFQKMCEESGTKFTYELWRGWVEAKQAELVPGAKEFMETVNKLGGKIVLISNNKDYEELPVRELLFAHGIAQGSHYGYMLTQALGSQSAKMERQKLVPALTRLTDRADDPGVAVTVVGSVGDQKTDEVIGIPFHPIPQGSPQFGMYGDPAVGQKPPPPDETKK